MTLKNVVEAMDVVIFADIGTDLDTGTNERDINVACNAIERLTRLADGWDWENAYEDYWFSPKQAFSSVAEFCRRSFETGLYTEPYKL
jgi:hypothetical protein